MKNYILYTLWLTFSVLVILLLMYYIPPVSVYGYTLRKVDLLSDIRFDEPEEDFPDSLNIIPLPVIKPAFVDTCRSGLTCIEDYSDSTLRGMTSFYEVLDKIDTLDRPVRIAVFGDSFIEADIFTADLRELLQQRYGGCGVGYVDITSGTNGYRPTVRHSFRGWRSHAATDSAYFERAKQGVSSRYFIPSAGAFVELRGQTKYASLLDTCEQSTIYFINNGSLTLSARINKDPEQAQKFASVVGLQKMEVEGKIGSVRWTVKERESALFFGVAMDGKKGITVDNFSLRGSSGLNLRYIPAKTLCEFNRLRPYDLIILQYGLNVATSRGSNYDNYKKGIMSSIKHLKECFPEAGFLLLSIGDRNQRLASGEIKTMLGVKNLLRYQQGIAAESGIAFWNMFEAMGGEESMRKLVDARPQMANYDYTHINFKGGKYLAELLYETLMYGKQQYNKRRAYEEE